MGIFNAKTTSVTVFGIKVAEVEVKREVGGGTSERREKLSSHQPLSIDPSLVTPILAEAVKRSVSLTPERFSFENGQDLQVDGNIDVYTGCQGLKKMFDFSEAVKVIFGVAALTNAYDKQNVGASGAFIGHLATVLKENWEEQKVFTS